MFYTYFKPPLPPCQVHYLEIFKLAAQNQLHNFAARCYHRGGKYEMTKGIQVLTNLSGGIGKKNG
jgi:hypothetical protein